MPEMRLAADLPRAVVGLSGDVDAELDENAKRSPRPTTSCAFSGVPNNALSPSFPRESSIVRTGAVVRLRTRDRLGSVPCPNGPNGRFGPE
jgi:hypothetical protein